MDITTRSQTDDEAVQPYAKLIPYCERIVEEVKCLYSLSYLLTADTRKAEQCFAEALAEFAEGSGDFVDWAPMHGRHAVVRHAVELIRPAPNNASIWSLPTRDEVSSTKPSQPLTTVITSLSTFERFVLIMSVLEGDSDDQCARLLGCSRWDVVIARELAQTIVAATAVDRDRVVYTATPFMPAPLLYQRYGSC